MKRYFLLLTILFFIVLGAGCSSSADTQDSQGHSIRLSDYQGKWVIINYWATWCKPCLKEMPALNALYQGNRDRLVVLGISYDKLSSRAINKVVQQWSIRYPMATHFPLKKLGIERVDVLPITFVINPAGKLVKTLKGPQTETQFKHAIGL